MKKSGYRIAVISSILALSLVTVTGCGKKYECINDAMSFGGTNSVMKKSKATSDMVMQEAEMVYEDRAEFKADNSVSQDAQKTYERKLIKNGYLTIRVSDFDKAEQDCNEWAKKYNGYVSLSRRSEYELYFKIQIPQELFDTAFNDFSSVGQVKEKNITIEDVSENYYDLETRLNTKKILKERLTKYLSEAKSMDEIIKIERELNNCTSQLESMQGQMNRLSSRINFSTIEITMTLPPQISGNRGIQVPDFVENLKGFVENTIGFFESFVLIIVGIALFGVPIVLTVALIYWLTFGKIGLVKKLFKKLKE